MYRVSMDVCVLLSVLICICIGNLGCRNSVQGPSGSVPPSANVSEANSHEWFLFVAQDTPIDTKKNLEPHLMDLVAKISKSGDQIHLVEAPAHRPIASFVVPDGNDRSRLRSQKIRSALQLIGKFLRQEPQLQNDDLAPEQLNIPSVAAAINGLKRTTLPSVVVLIGTPIFDSATAAGWSMTTGSVPSDASLNSEFCPFGLDSKFGGETEIRWLVSSTDWGQGQAHRSAIIRFYQHYFGKNGGKLSRITSDASAVFLPTTNQTLVAQASLGEPDGYVGMVSVVQRSRQVASNVQTSEIPVVQKTTFAQTTEVSTPQDVDRMLREAQSRTDRIFVAINWIGMKNTSSSDIDLWIKSSGQDGELNYSNMSTSFGKLYRDVRSSGSVDDESDNYQSWECAEILHDRLEELTVWLNAYATSQPVKIRAIVVWKGQLKEKTFDFEVEKGDNARNKHNRQRDPAWKHIDINSIF